VDYAGQTIAVVHPLTGAVHEAALFLAVLGASTSPCAEATWSQRLPDGIGSPIRAFEAVDGGPQGLVPDHLKAAVPRAQRYAPTLNRTSAELAQPSGGAIVPARAATPRDKATVDVGVHIGARWMLARLRHSTFFSLPEVHPAIPTLLGALNTRPCTKLPGSRARLCAAIARPALPPLPAQPYASAEGQRVRVHIDSHVAGEGHYDSVPYRLVRQPLAARLSAQGVESCHKGHRVASHQRSPHQGRPSPGAAHLPTAQPGLCRVDPPAAEPVGRHNGRGHGAGGGGDARRASPSPARLPRVPGTEAAGATLGRGAPRSRLPAGRDAWGLCLPEHRIDAQTRLRPAPLASHARCPPRHHPWH
jgi:hypothetical protein